MRALEDVIVEQIAKKQVEMREEGVSLIYAHIEYAIDKGAHIDDIEQMIDSMQDMELKMLSYRYLMHILYRKLSVYIWNK